MNNYDDIQTILKEKQRWKALIMCEIAENEDNSQMQAIINKYQRAMKPLRLTTVGQRSRHLRPFPVKNLM